MDPKETEGILQMEWAAISAAPFLFITALVVFCGLTWIVAKFVYRQQIATLKERLELAHEQAQATEKARQEVETRVNNLEEAVEQDATQRDQKVSPDVATAVSATEDAMERLKEKESDLSATIKVLMAERFV